MSAFTRLHDQFPLSQVTDEDYDTLVCHLTEQLAALMDAQGGYPEGEAACRAVDVLANTYGSRDGMTVYDWMRDASSAVGVNVLDLRGI
jgi:hypothetical protein